MNRILLILVVALIILHQDNWFWEDPTLAFGFMPVGLCYHACLSLAAACVWFLAARYCWPLPLEETLGENRDSVEGSQA